MVKDVKLKPFAGTSSLPTYTRWQGLKVYKLTAEIMDSYEITLAVLTVGQSASGKNNLSHVLFESYDEHGRKMAEVRMRTSGYEREFMAITGAMVEAGITFGALDPSCSVEDILTELGEWYETNNPDIQSFKVTLQERE